MAEDVKTVKTTETTQTTVHSTPILPREEQVSAPAEPSMLSNVLAIIGFIILIVVIIWGLIHIATLTSPWFSSFFNKNTPATIQVTAPANVTSGDPFTVSWKYSPSTSGSYAFLYQCKAGLQFETAGTTGTMNAVPCGAAFTVGTATSLSLTPILSGTTALSEPLSVIFLSSTTGAAQVQGSATVTVNPAATKVTQPMTTKPVTVKKYTGPADLSVRIISAGVDGSGRGTVSFDIANVGSGASGVYSFEAFLPTTAYNSGIQSGLSGQGYTYNSPAQVSLAPGEHVVSTLSFTQAMTGTVSVLVDPSNTLTESNKTNNYDSATISAPYYNNYNYPPQTYYPAPTYSNQTYPVYPVTY